MIFVFSGTGNSYHVAKRIASDAEMDMVEIAAAVRYKRSFYNAEGQDVGFVFPTFFLSVPSIVEEFLSTVEIRNPGFTYCISTCADESGKACEQAQEALGKKLRIDAFYDVAMPNNAQFYENPPDKQEAERINREADAEVDSIIAAIKAKEKGDHRRHSKAEDADKYREMYEEFRNTEPFVVDENCIECRICEHVCPEQIIKVYHRKPVWDEIQCSMCMSCINMCPKKSIQFGEETVGRNRYFHPEYYMWSLGVNPPYKHEDFKKYDSGMRY